MDSAKLKEIFKNDPHITKVWVNEAGEYWLVKREGTRLVELHTSKPRTAKAEAPVAPTEAPAEEVTTETAEAPAEAPEEEKTQSKKPNKK